MKRNRVDARLKDKEWSPKIWKTGEGSKRERIKEKAKEY